MPDDLTAFFDDLAPRWEAMQSPARHSTLTRILTPHADLFAGARRVLDVGAGTGAFWPHLAQIAPQAQIVALDLSPEMLRRARASEHASQVGLWLRADGTRLPLAAAHVDHVTCHNTFAHFESRLAALREFARVLLPGGWLFVLHDIPRAQVNAIHQGHAHPRVQAHHLIPVANVLPEMAAAGFHVERTHDADYYLIAARKA